MIVGRTPATKCVSSKANMFPAHHSCQSGVQNLPQFKPCLEERMRQLRRKGFQHPCAGHGAPVKSNFYVPWSLAFTGTSGENAVDLSHLSFTFFLKKTRPCWHLDPRSCLFFIHVSGWKILRRCPLGIVTFFVEGALRSMLVLIDRCSF